ncbi:unnamed protein product [Dibothriocephalus latus]|uniref:Uncharacterized protein n=1 Tax=Dibothriocephalus latus TaxID=60516 RepID=A0A3P7KZ53_DIBLA|nr:unnamed protein product [Dibothriocephalus latus]
MASKGLSPYRSDTLTLTLMDRRPEVREDVLATPITTYRSSRTARSASRQTSRDRQEHTYTPKSRATPNLLETPSGTTVLTFDDLVSVETPSGTTVLTFDDLVSGKESSLLEGDLTNLTSEDEQKQRKKPGGAEASEGITSHHEESDAYSEDFESENEAEVLDERKSPGVSPSPSSTLTQPKNHNIRSVKQMTEVSVTNFNYVDTGLVRVIGAPKLNYLKSCTVSGASEPPKNMLWSTDACLK